MEQLTFEEALAKMEEVVTKLEQGDLPLEEMINLYQEGMVLSQVCDEKLNQASTTIQTLVQEDGTIVEKNGPFQL